MAFECQELTKSIKGKEAISTEADVKALRTLLIIITENADFDAN